VKESDRNARAARVVREASALARRADALASLRVLCALRWVVNVERSSRVIQTSDSRVLLVVSVMVGRVGVGVHHGTFQDSM
jgi:hypothetical protein